MPARHSRLPDVWIVSDARNDAALEPALSRAPRGSGLVFRHYHLAPADRGRRWRKLLRACRLRGHLAVFAGTMAEARRKGADGAYGPAARLARGGAGLRLVTVHSLAEMVGARAARADALVLSPVFPTRSHPGAPALGPTRFRLMARRAGVPVIALGGMDARRARAIGARKWAAVQAFG